MYVYVHAKYNTNEEKWLDSSGTGVSRGNVVKRGRRE